MDLQTVFYVVAIIAFVLFIILLLIVIYFIFFLKSLIGKTHHQVMEKIIEYTKPVDVMKGISSAVASNFVLKLKDIFSSNHK